MDPAATIRKLRQADLEKDEEIARLKIEIVVLKRRILELEGASASTSVEEQVKIEPGLSPRNNRISIPAKQETSPPLESRITSPPSIKAPAGSSKDAPVIILDSDSETEAEHSQFRQKTQPVRVNLKRRRSPSADLDLTFGEPSDDTSTPPATTRRIKKVRKPAPGVDTPPTEHDHKDEEKEEKGYVKLTEAEGRAALKSYFNPKAEIKSEMLLSDEQVLSRLDLVGREPYPVTLDAALRDITVSRDHISRLFGGNNQDTFPHISQKNVERHGYNHFMCLNLLYNPHAPQLPGYPGLYFETSPAIEPWTSEHARVQMVFVRLQSKMWFYVGNYKMTAAPSLTEAQWLEQDGSVRRKWAQEIHDKGWGRSVRVRIHLRRRLGREPDGEDIEDALKEKNAFKDVTPMQILAAYDSAEEVMGVWCMKCVGYTEAFQRELVENL